MFSTRKYSIRKVSVGIASVLIGIVAGSLGTAYAHEDTNNVVVTAESNHDVNLEHVNKPVLEEVEKPMPKSELAPKLVEPIAPPVCEDCKHEENIVEPKRESHLVNVVDKPALEKVENPIPVPEVVSKPEKKNESVTPVTGANKADNLFKSVLEDKIDWNTIDEKEFVNYLFADIKVDKKKEQEIKEVWLIKVNELLAVNPNNVNLQKVKAILENSLKSNSLVEIEKTKEKKEEKKKEEDSKSIAISELEQIIDILNMDEENDQNLKQQDMTKNIEVFSIDIFEKRKKLYEKNIELAKIGNPENYVEHKRLLEDSIKHILRYQEVKDDEKAKEKLIEELILEYQQVVYDMLEDRIEAIYTNEEVIDEIYRQRYIRYQNVGKNKYIYQVTELYQKMDNVLHLIVEKALKFDILERLSEEDNTNYAAISPALKTAILSLEDIRVALYTGKITLLCIYDGNVLIKEIELFDVDPKLISIPTKKKIKLFKGKK